MTLWFHSLGGTQENEKYIQTKANVIEVLLRIGKMYSNPNVH